MTYILFSLLLFFGNKADTLDRFENFFFLGGVCFGINHNGFMLAKRDYLVGISLKI